MEYDLPKTLRLTAKQREWMLETINERDVADYCANSWWDEFLFDFTEWDSSIEAVAHEVKQRIPMILTPMQQRVVQAVVMMAENYASEHEQNHAKAHSLRQLYDELFKE